MDTGAESKASSVESSILEYFDEIGLMMVNPSDRGHGYFHERRALSLYTNTDTKIISLPSFNSFSEDRKRFSISTLDSPLLIRRLSLLES